MSLLPSCPVISSLSSLSCVCTWSWPCLHRYIETKIQMARISFPPKCMFFPNVCCFSGHGTDSGGKKDLPSAWYVLSRLAGWIDRGDAPNSVPIDTPCMTCYTWGGSFFGGSMYGVNVCKHGMHGVFGIGLYIYMLPNRHFYYCSKYGHHWQVLLDELEPQRQSHLWPWRRGGAACHTQHRRARKNILRSK